MLPLFSFLAVPQASPHDRLPMGQVLIPMTPCDLRVRERYNDIIPCDLRVRERYNDITTYFNIHPGANIRAPCDLRVRERYNDITTYFNIRPGANIRGGASNSLYIVTWLDGVGRLWFSFGLFQCGVLSVCTITHRSLNHSS